MPFISVSAPLGFFHDPKTSMSSWTDVTSINLIPKDVISKSILAECWRKDILYWLEGYTNIILKTATTLAARNKARSERFREIIFRNL